MAKLAIKGHATRGKEVIEILEMLGGKNTRDYSTYSDSVYFYIKEDSKSISFDWFETPNSDKDFTIYDLEEFLEKYPYKVGDKVITDNGDKASIVGMVWDSDIDDVFYDTQICNEIFKYPKELLQPYKEEAMEERDKAMAPNLVGEDYSGKRFGYKIPQGYEFDCIQNNEIIIKPIKPQYPKTYKECCDVLGLNTMDNDAQGYEADLIIRFQELLIARGAYWKIAGEKMGLEKPWEPDWKKQDKKYIISVFEDAVIYFENETYNHNTILAFPTEEMRDAFYENFKNLIETCKELL